MGAARPYQCGEVILKVNRTPVRARSIGWLGLGKHGIDVRDESRMKAVAFSILPPSGAAPRPEQLLQQRSTSRFESSLRENTALCPIPNVKSCPRILLQHLLQP